MDTLEKSYQDIIQQFFPETAHRIPIYKSIKKKRLPFSLQKRQFGRGKGKKGIQEKRLSEKYNSKDLEEIFANFMDENKKTIGSMVAQHGLGRGEYDDVLQDALLYVADYIADYDPDISKPNTWLNNLLKYRIQHKVANTRIPDAMKKHGGLQKDNEKIKRESVKFTAETGREPTNRELSELTGFSEEKIDEIKQLDKHTIHIEQQTDEESPISVDSILGQQGLSKQGLTPEEYALYNERFDDMINAINQLDDEKEKEAVKMGFGFGEDGIIYTNREIANKLGVTPSYVTRIINSGLDKMREHLSEYEKSTKLIDTLEKSYHLRITREEIKNNLQHIIKSINTQSIVKTKKEDPLRQIRIRQRDPKIFDKKSMRTIALSKSLGIEAVIGELPNDSKTRVQTLIFNKDNDNKKVWTLKEAKNWVKSHKERIKVSMNLKELLLKAKNIMEKENDNV